MLCLIWNLVEGKFRDINLKLKLPNPFSFLFYRMAAERDLEKSDFNMSNNIIFDASGHFLLYPTLIGIKVINIETNRCVNILGKTDNIRPLHIALFQVGLIFGKNRI